jgi:hypothetical protein
MKRPYFASWNQARRAFFASAVSGVGAAWGAAPAAVRDRRRDASRIRPVDFMGRMICRRRGQVVRAGGKSVARV